MTNKNGAEQANAAQPGQAESSRLAALTRIVNPRAMALPASILAGCFLAGAVCAGALMLLTSADSDSNGATPGRANASPNENGLLPLANASADEPLDLNLATKTPEEFGSLTVSLQEGDRLLLSGQPGPALRMYNQLLEAQPRAPEELRFRMAICGELLGDFQHALLEYRSIASETERSYIALAAEMRQVFLFLQLSRPELAKQSLWKSVLAPPRDDAAPTSGQGEFLHVLAQVLATQAEDDAHHSLLTDGGITFPTFRFSVEETLGLLNQELKDSPSGKSTKPAADKDADATATSTIVVNQRLGERPDETFVQVHLPRMPLANALDIIGRETDTRIHWSTLAREAASEHAAEAHLDDIALAGLLDGLLDPHDLVWHYKDGDLRIFGYEELPESARGQLRITTVERALQQALVSYPDHPLVDEAYWSLGNLAFIRGDAQLAQIHYLYYLRQFPRANDSARVHFNLAKIRLALRRPAEALQNFYFVIDADPNDPLAPPAYLYAGRLYLENDEARRAVKPLTRAIALARDQNQRALAVLTVAAAYLMDDKPFAANRMLMEFREELRSPTHFDQAAFLGALARFRAAKLETQFEHEGRALVNALSHIDPTDFFGYQAYLLIAEAYRDLELLPEMSDVLARGAAITSPGALRDRMLFQLAVYQEQSGQNQTALESYDALATHAADPWRSDADLRRATLAVTLKDSQVAQVSCRRLLSRPEATTSVDEVLRALGRAYQLEGDYERAAQCFAGVAPDFVPPKTNEEGDRDVEQVTDALRGAEDTTGGMP
ncbi:MAG: tetratricopeptide repeat protein [Planctomycetales bacterium]|nr:tetratricopeptide repeat protein [Planctomycetales bacterium]